MQSQRLGTCQVTFPELDTDDWEPHNTGDFMPRTHIVKEGECFASIAKRYDFGLWQTIYEAPDNEKLRSLRPNPNILYPGDKVVIPDKRERIEFASTDLSHKFKAKSPKWIFRLEMKDEEMNPIDDAPYELRVEGMETHEGRTDADGLIEVPIKEDAKKGTLLFLGDEIELEFGMLDPISTVKGVQARLNNLGYVAGSVDGQVGTQTSKAVLAFQSSQDDLEATGEIDDDTLQRLLELHDNDQQMVDPEEDMAQTYTRQDKSAEEEEQAEESDEPWDDDSDDAESIDWPQDSGYED